MNQMPILTPRLYAVQPTRDALQQDALFGPTRAIRDAAAAARADIFDIDVAEVEAVIARLGDHSYARRLTLELAELQETTDGNL